MLFSYWKPTGLHATRTSVALTGRVSNLIIELCYLRFPLLSVTSLYHQWFNHGSTTPVGLQTWFNSGTIMSVPWQMNCMVVPWVRPRSYRGEPWLYHGMTTMVNLGTMMMMIFICKRIQ